MTNKKIAVIGGDKRMLFAAAELFDAGYGVYLCGFDRLKSLGGLRQADAEDALSRCDIAALPVTGLRDGKIPCGFGCDDIDFKTIESLLADKLVFCGRGSCKNSYDILSDEDFLLNNAVPTAEGALLEAMKNYEDDIAGSDALVIGYGRIGAALSRLMRAVGARVTVSTRSARKSVMISRDGNTPVCTAGLDTLDGFDIVFNTADALVIDRAVLENTTGDPVIIDLASAPGGADLDAAKDLGFTVVQALALPGRYSPKSAGRAIFEVIDKKIRGEYA